MKMAIHQKETFMCNKTTPEQQQGIDFLWEKIAQHGSVTNWINFDQNLPQAKQEIKKLVS
jgi:hypothetical protein